MTDTHLMIPSTGILEVFEDPHGDLDIERVLTSRGGEGTLISLTFGTSVVWWFVNGIGPVNPRARETLVLIEGPHTVFTGPVMFCGLAPEKVGEIVAHLSRKE